MFDIGLLQKVSSNISSKLLLSTQEYFDHELVTLTCGRDDLASCIEAVPSAAVGTCRSSAPESAGILAVESLSCLAAADTPVTSQNFCNICRALRPGVSLFADLP